MPLLLIEESCWFSFECSHIDATNWRARVDLNFDMEIVVFKQDCSRR